MYTWLVSAKVSIYQTRKCISLQVLIAIDTIGTFESLSAYQIEVKTKFMYKSSSLELERSGVREIGVVVHSEFIVCS